MADYTIIATFEYDDFGGFWTESPIGLDVFTTPLTYADTDTTFAIGEDLLSPNGINYMGFIIIDGTAYPVVTGPGGDATTPTVLIPQGKDPNSITFPSTVDTNNFVTSPFFTDPFNHCFVSGTLIATTEGEIPVEQLTRDHKVITADGRAVAVQFLGWQDVPTQAPIGRERAIVRIAAGSLGNGLPRRDLTVTGDHAMMLDGMLVNASALVNGTTIRFLSGDEIEPVVRVYHVETEAHEVLLAEGAPSESFIDYAGRAKLGNYAEYLDIHGADRIIREMAAPRVTSARLLPPAIRARLDTAAGVSDAGVEAAA